MASTVYIYIYVLQVYYSIVQLEHHTEVRWLSRLNVLKRVFARRHEVISLVSERALKGFQEFSDEVWLCQLGLTERWKMVEDGGKWWKMVEY